MRGQGTNGVERSQAMGSCVFTTSLISMPLAAAEEALRVLPASGGIAPLCARRKDFDANPLTLLVSLRTPS